MWELTLSGHEAVGLMELTHLDPALDYIGKEEACRCCSKAADNSFSGVLVGATSVVRSIGRPRT
jgi:hypothetical protein